MPEEIVVVIEPDGCSRHLVSNVATFADLGEPVSIARASHVETWSSLTAEAICGIKIDETYADWWGRRRLLWWTDMLPCNGPVLGPFETQAAALAAEIQWLNDNNLPPPEAL